MAISRIRGEQIKQQVLRNEHIANDAAIQESKLSINWASHYQNALVTKKVVDFVQVNGTVVGGLSEADISAVIPNTVPNVLSDPLTGEGVIVDAPKNRAIIRDKVSGDPVLDANGHEVFGRITFNEVGNKFELKFYVFDPAANDGAGAEIPHTMEVGQAIDWQYAKRFNLDSVDEMFAANEKFVEGAADATAHLNIDQLAKDLYGASFSLDRDGNGNLTTSLIDQMANEIEARTAAVQAVRDDLASTAAGKGASQVGVEDVAGNYTATTVEGVLAEIKTSLNNLSNGGSTTQTEVDAARSSVLTGDHADLDARLEAGETRFEAVKTEVEGARGTFGSLDERLDDIESDLAAEATARAEADTAIRNDLASNEAGKGASLIGLEDVDGKVTATTVEGAVIELADRATAVEDRATAVEGVLTAAKGTAASLDERLDRALNEDGTLKAGKEIHKHFKAYYQAVGGESVVDLSAFNVAALPAYQVGDQSLSVYVNGILQNDGLHYSEVAGGLSVNFGMSDSTTLVAGDIVTIMYHINNAE